MIQCKKPLSMYNLHYQTESVNQKVPSGIIYSRNNLLHLDPGLFQYLKYIEMTVPMHRVIAELFLFYYERDLMMSLSDDTQADI